MAKAEHQYELEQLRTRLAEAEETLAAIRQGDVDALVVSGPQGEQVYTLRGADYSSRILLQEMNEGAITLLCDGPILYCNRRFAEMLKLPHEKVIGFSVQRFVAPSDTEAFENLLKQGRKDQSRAEINFSAADGTVVPAYCSVNPIKLNSSGFITPYIAINSGSADTITNAASASSKCLKDGGTTSMQRMMQARE